MQVEILSERELPNGLAFRASVGDEGPARAAARLVEVRLHWADYNLWSVDGADPPERVAAAVVRFAASHGGVADLPDSFDAAALRRRHPDADSAIARLVRFGG